MIIRREIGKKGQVVIPKDIRTFLGIKSGENVIFEVRNKEVVLKQQDNTNFLEEFLNVSKKLNKGIRIKDIKEVIDEQY